MEPSRKRRKLHYRRYLCDYNEPLPRTTRYRMAKIDPLDDDDESSHSDWSEDDQVSNNKEASLDYHTSSDSDATGATVDSEQSHDEHANCDGVVGASMDSENGHDVENSDEEEGSLNDEPEQALYDHTTSESDSTGVSLDIGHIVEDCDEAEVSLDDEHEQQSLDDYTNSGSEGLGFEHHSSSHTDDYDGGDDTTSDSEQMVNDDMMRSPLYQGALVTLGQTILLLMAFAVIVGLTQDGLQTLLQILSLILPQDSHLPATKYLFKKLFKTGKYDFHVYCPKCCCVLENNACKRCHQDFDKNELMKNGNFFFTLPLIDQLKHSLETSNLGESLNYRKTRPTNPDTISDIMDGKLYKQMCKDSNLKKDYSFSLTFNSDGVPIFKSSSFSIWPLLCHINELPPNIRKKTMFLTGLWFGPKKPSISTFFRPFINEMKTLSSVGFEWCSNAKIVKSYVYAIICSCDSVARAMLQNIKQFNGKFGCNWCLHPGERVEKGKGHVQVYPFHEEVTERSHTDMIKYQRNVGTGENFGVKGPTPLSSLPFFDIVSGFIVDSMHCIDLGVMRQLSTLWFDSSFHKEPWYIGTRANEIDRKIEQFQPPSNITRMPRSILTRAYWKASEWRAFLLFYAPIVLKSVLPRRFFEHFLLLCQAVYALQTTCITQLELFYASQHLNEFVLNFETLYGRPHMTYNVHILLHLSDSVRNWGPLWCYSAYSFEGCNGFLLKLYNGTQSVPLQIVTSFLLLKEVESMGKVLMQNAHPRVQQLFDTVVDGFNATKHVRRVNGTVFFGHGCSRALDLYEKDAVEQFLENPVKDQAIFYHKAVYNSQIFLSINYRRKLKRDNTLVRRSDGSVCQIVGFAKVESHTGCEHALCLVRKCVSKPRLFLQGYFGESRCQIKHVMSISSEFAELTVLDLSQLSDKFVVYRQENSCLVCLLPNSLERD
ncbi:hypothetical protein E1301_Tti023124 [Triplophysa tibetana]|uniref:Transposase domain-containing protein n=2 Tax=Triplophysa tibetana TaxID=1572043 RepID=A0A5A9PK43_9TELE|nr:hypothetical protein E1301_Tti023398 [Triplophysa tibetana]KAA0722757.1 hypothetical protein E1301_Tti023124 [Triplophysa tibetana]